MQWNIYFGNTLYQIKLPDRRINIIRVCIAHETKFNDMRNKIKNNSKFLCYTPYAIISAAIPNQCEWELAIGSVLSTPC